MAKISALNMVFLVPVPMQRVLEDNQRLIAKIAPKVTTQTSSAPQSGVVRGSVQFAGEFHLVVETLSGKDTWFVKESDVVAYLVIDKAVEEVK